MKTALAAAYLVAVTVTVLIIVMGWAVVGLIASF